MPRFPFRRFRLRAPGLLLLIAALAGCARPAPKVATDFRWWVGRDTPSFDPGGPPDPVRAALERLLTRSLMRLDSLGRPIPDAAERVAVSEDHRRYTFTLRSDLRFVDGEPCTSESFRAGLLAGLARSDHSTLGWVLAAVRGVEGVRARRPLPAIGITAPAPNSLVLELALPDSLLLQKLAIPGVGTAWKSLDATADWSHAVGLGPYAIRAAGEHAMVLSRAWGGGPDTIHVRFSARAARARTVLRASGADLLWPLPPTMLDQPIAPEWVVQSRAAFPERRLSLVFRADVPPMHKLAARRVLAHGIERSEIPRRLGRGAAEIGEWLPGTGRADLPNLDQAQVLDWLDRGKLGRSLHANLAYDADGAGAAVARGLQGDWARSGQYVDLEPLRGEAMEREALGGQAHLLLIEEQGLIPGLAGILAESVMPLRGPAVGAFRSGWRTRDFDPWILPRRPGSAPDPQFARRRMEEETVVVPLARLDWVWIERAGGPNVKFDPRTGPAPATRSVP